MTPQEKAERLRYWILMLSALPPDTPEAFQRDLFWKKELESELASLEVNSLAKLSRVKNHLRKMG